jgi:hypothetical protein
MEDQLRVESGLMLSWKYAARLGEGRFRVVDLDMRNAKCDGRLRTGKTLVLYLQVKRAAIIIAIITWVLVR